MHEMSLRKQVFSLMPAHRSFSKKRYRIGLHPRESDGNEFVGLFTKALESCGFTTSERPASQAELVAVDLIVFHWPWYFQKSVSFRDGLRGLRDLFAARRNHGLKVIWLAHNAQPHEGANRLISWLFFRQLDGIIYLSNHSRHVVRSAHKLSRNVRELVTVHGVYVSADNPVDPPMITSAGLNLFSFGMVRSYKGFDQLLQAARGTSNLNAIKIAGRIMDEDYALTLIDLAHGLDIVSLDMREDFLPNAELDSMIDACHGVVMPYREILNSGAALHALSRARPVLVPNRGSMPELQETLGSEWVHLFDGDLTNRILEDFIAHLQTMPVGARPDLSAFSWQRVSRDLACFIEDMMEAKP